jgi:hypothetical protein
MNATHEKIEDRLKVFYVHAHSINPYPQSSVKLKNEYINKIIEKGCYYIIAIAETWLKHQMHSTEDVQRALGLENYKIYRHDRVDVDSNGNIRRGGGLLVAIKLKENLKSTCIFSYNDNFVLIKLTNQFNCLKCSDGLKSQDYMFGLVYRRGVPYEGQTPMDFDKADKSLMEKIKNQMENFLTIPSVIVGDFNLSIRFEMPAGMSVWDFERKRPENIFKFFAYDMYADWNVVFTNSKERNIYEMFEDYEFQQKIAHSTHEHGGILDLVFSKPKNFIYDIGSRGQVQLNSNHQDHLSITFKLKLGYDCKKKF